MSTTFYTIGASHYCEKARWAMDRAAVPYNEVTSAPFLHMFKTKPAGGRTVPILVVEGDDAERTTLYQSADIVRYADRNLADALKLDDGNADANAFAAELDRSLGPHARAYIYQRLFEDPQLSRRIMTIGTSNGQRRVLNTLYPVINRVMTKGMRLSPENADKSHARVGQWFDAIAEQLGDKSYLFGDRFGIADITAACLAGPLVAAPEYQRALPTVDELPERVRAEIAAFRDHPAGKYVLRMFRDHRADCVA